MIWVILGLAVATFGSEDLTCITAGQLARMGHIAWMPAVLGCLVGIYLGDLGLWVLGYLVGRCGFRLPWIKVKKFEGFFSGGAIVAARFLPGTRLPLYLAAGAVGPRPWHFACWSLLAAVLWTPCIVLLAAVVGEGLLMPLRKLLGASWYLAPIAIVGAFVILRMLSLTFTEIGRYRLLATIARVWRWEFWPAWLFYLPVFPWIVWLSIRYRGFGTIAAANPGIPTGGFVGESKFQILSSLRSPHVIRTELIDELEPSRRAGRCGEWTYPVIIKPDVGERGAGVRLVRTEMEAVEELSRTSHVVIVQPYDPGPLEAGVFYYRYPGERAGRIFSITEKRFAAVEGDGESTLEQLIWRHPRYRMQAKRFLARHAGDRVLGRGERLQLAIAGNHCQGTMFFDGSQLITPELESKIDSIARTFDAFYFGRFDVRFADVDAFKRGEDFRIIELNGAASESTNIYDPSRGLTPAYRTLIQQWRILFQIGAANRRRGERGVAMRELVHAVRAHWRRDISALSD